MAQSSLQYNACLALGSNLGDRHGYLVNAVRELAATPGIQILAVSNVYETAPVGPVTQGSYLNACLLLRTSLGALELLRTGLQIETRNGRVRDRRFGPRTLDIDLLSHSGTAHIQTPELILPHPRLHQRAFVLVPLAEIAADLEIHSRTVADWLGACPRSDIDDVQPTQLHLHLPTEG